MTTATPFPHPLATYSLPGGLLWQQVASSDGVPLHPRLCVCGDERRVRRRRRENKQKTKTREQQREGEVCPARSAKTEETSRARLLSVMKWGALRCTRTPLPLARCSPVVSVTQSHRVVWSTGMESRRWRRFPSSPHNNRLVFRAAAALTCRELQHCVLFKGVTCRCRQIHRRGNGFFFFGCIIHVCTGFRLRCFFILMHNRRLARFDGGSSFWHWTVVELSCVELRLCLPLMTADLHGSGSNKWGSISARSHISTVLHSYTDCVQIQIWVTLSPSLILAFLKPISGFHAGVCFAVLVKNQHGEWD